MKNSILLISLAFLTGCTLFEAQEPLPLYTLESGHYKPSQGFSTSINIDEPKSEPGLDTIRISLKPNPYQQEYVANGSWPERLPKIFQNQLIQGFSQKWGGQNVNRLSDGVAAQYILSSNIEDFSVLHYPGKHPQVSISITFKLIHFMDRKVIAAKTFCQKTPIQNFTMLGIVSTLSQCTHSLIDKAADWIEESLQR